MEMRCRLLGRPASGVDLGTTGVKSHVGRCLVARAQPDLASLVSSPPPSISVSIFSFSSARYVALFPRI